jgi:Ca2+-dependent lipid-binding protein
MSYVVHFNLIEGKNMPAMDVGLFSSSSDLYVITHVGSNSHKSKIIMKSLKPIWNEKFSIKFNNLNDEAIFQVFGKVFKFKNKKIMTHFLKTTL